MSIHPMNACIAYQAVIICSRCCTVYTADREIDYSQRS